MFPTYDSMFWIYLLMFSTCYCCCYSSIFTISELRSLLNVLSRDIIQVFLMYDLVLFNTTFVAAIILVIYHGLDISVDAFYVSLLLIWYYIHNISIYSSVFSIYNSMSPTYDSTFWIYLLMLSTCHCCCYGIIFTISELLNVWSIDIILKMYDQVFLMYDSVLFNMSLLLLWY